MISSIKSNGITTEPNIGKRFLAGFVGIIKINSTERNQKVGDLWAKTLVVKTKDLKEPILKKPYSNMTSYIIIV